MKNQKNIPAIFIILLILLSIVLSISGCAGNAQEHLQKGNSYLEQQQWQEAINEYNSAIKIDPNLAEAYCNRASAYGSLGKLTLAKADLDKAIELNPKMAKAYDNRGKIYLVSSKYEEAITDFSTAIDFDPTLARPIAIEAGLISTWSTLSQP